jgi:Zn-finger protein
MFFTANRLSVSIQSMFFSPSVPIYGVYDSKAAHIISAIVGSVNQCADCSTVYKNNALLPILTVRDVMISNV